MLNSINTNIHKFFKHFKISKIAKKTSDPVIDHDKAFCRIYNKCKPYTMTSKERMYALYKAVEYIIKAKIEGDFVECGVWKGGSMMLVALALLEMEVTTRNIYLYDTFEGMSEPTENDYKFSEINNETISNWKEKLNIYSNKWCYSSLVEVENNMAKTRYPLAKTVFIKGKVEETISLNSPKKISLLRLDTDWYESTLHELNFLYPILSKNGVIIIDDYGHWAGSKKAVDQYFYSKPILLNRIDYTGRIAIKID